MGSPAPLYPFSDSHEVTEGVLGVIERPKIVIFGDSLTEFGSCASTVGWVHRMAEYYNRRVDIINRGYGGYNTALARCMCNAVFACLQRVDIVFIQFGGNDAHPLVRGPDTDKSVDTTCTPHVPLEEYKQNLRWLIEAVRKATTVQHIILIGPPATDEDFIHLNCIDNATLKEYGEACGGVASETNCLFVDLFNKLIDQPNFKGLFTDGEHFTARGNALAFEAIRETIEQHLPSWAAPNRKLDALEWTPAILALEKALK